MYEKLAKIYYKQSEEAYFKEYEKRLNDYGTMLLPLKIKPLKSNEEFQCFYVNHHGLMNDYEAIMKKSSIIRNLMEKLPEAALHHYVQTRLIDELVNTNKIEGIRSTRAEMKKVLELENPKKNIKYKSFVNSYFHILKNPTWTKLDSIQEIRKIYDTLVSAEIPLDDQLDGKMFRKNGVEVISGGQKIIHKGIEPESAIKDSLEKLIVFLNEYEAPKLYKIAVAHYYFGYIHPYYDGNGRSSRYISSLYLKNELDILTALTLSSAIEQNKKLYYDGFDDANHRLNKGEFTHFCQSFFKILLFAQNNILDELDKKIKQLDKLFTITEFNMEDFTPDERNVIFALGQHYLFGSEGEGIQKKELEIFLKMSHYKINKTLETLQQQNIIQILKKKPLIIALSEKITDLLE